MEKSTRKMFTGICTCLCLALPVGGWAANADLFKTEEYYKSTGLDFIHAADAYALGYTGKGIRLTLLDMFVRFDHSEFASKADLQEYFNSTNPGWEVSYHGTAVAGIMAASKDGTGIHGVAFDAGLVSLATNDLSAYDIVTLYPKTFADTSLKIINNSWGDDIYPEYYRKSGEYLTLLDTRTPGILATFQTAILNYDKVLVWAAGNSGHLSAANGSLAYAAPELARNLVNVVAFDPSRKTTDPNFLAEFTEHALFVEENSIAAPGVNIYSSVPFGDGTGYEAASGTSVATPYVSGTLGLVQQAFPYMTGKQLVDTVLSTANNNFVLPRYTVGLQADCDEVKNITYGSIYLVYFGNEQTSREQRDRDLRDFYAQSTAAQNEFSSVDAFLKRYYRNNLWYGSERYYTNVPWEIMFGQGLLDAGKAVRGPGLLNARRLSATDYSTAYGSPQALYSIDTKGYNSIWSNDIGEKRVSKYSDAYQEFYKAFYGGLYAGGRYGEGLSYAEGEAFGQAYYDSLNAAVLQNILYELPVGLLKSGNGTLALTGNNTYQGTSIVTGGTLQIDGSVVNDVYSEMNGTVAGSGTLGRNLINHGTVQAGSWGAVGNLTIKGDLLSTGAVVVTVKDGSVSRLLVKGSASVEGSKVIPNGIVTPNESYSFLSADNGINGNFVPTQFSLFLTTNPIHDQTNASFQVSKTASLTSLSNLNSSQQISAKGLEKMYESLQGQKLPVELSTIYNSQTEAIAGATLQETYGGVQASMVAATPLGSAIGRAVNARLSSPAAYTDPKDKKQGRTFAMADNNVLTDIYARTVLPLHFDADNNWWMKRTNGWSDTASDRGSGLAAITTKSSGFVIGYDQNLNKTWRVGALIGYGKDELSTASAKGDSQDHRFGLYGGYNRQALDVNAYIAAGKQSNHTLRYLPTVGLTASSEYDSRTIELGVKAKYNLRHQQERTWEISPYAGLTVQRYSQDGFSETGAGVLSQQAEKLINIYSTAEFGIEASRKVTNGKYMVSAGYKRVLSGDNPELRVNFAGNPGGKFTVRGNEQSCDWLVLGVSAEGKLAKDWTVYGEVQGEFSGKETNNSASISVRHYW